MARPRKVDDARMIHLLVDQKLTRIQISEETGLGVSGVDQMIRSLRQRGLLPRTQRLSHTETIPWKMRAEHSTTTVANYLRILSSVAQGKDIPRDSRNTAFRWAQNLVDQTLDVDYDRDRPPNEFCVQGGFFPKNADPKDWHLKKVLEKAKMAA